MEGLASVGTIPSSELIKQVHLPGSRAAPAAILQMSDPQVPPGHWDLLVGICSSADDILKSVLFLRDLYAWQGGSEASCLQGLAKLQGLPPTHSPSWPTRQSGDDHSPPMTPASTSQTSGSPLIPSQDSMPSPAGTRFPAQPGWKKMQLHPPAMAKGARRPCACGETEVQRGEEDDSKTDDSCVMK